MSPKTHLYSKGRSHGRKSITVYCAHGIQVLTVINMLLYIKK